MLTVPDRSVNFALTGKDFQESLFRRANFTGQYLRQERDDVTLGGYTPSVDDSEKLTKCLSENVNVPHPSENAVEELGNNVNVPLSVGLKTVENVVWPYSIFGQVITMHFYNQFH